MTPPFLTSALGGGEWSSSCPSRFIPKKVFPGYPLYKRLGRPQTPYGRYGEEKNLDPAGNRTPAIQLLAGLYID
jgi:hypothetical protein